MVAASVRKNPRRVQPRLARADKLTFPRMDFNQLADGLIQYLMLVGLLTFHEFGHAWTALKCGDDTALL